MGQTSTFRYSMKMAKMVSLVEIQHVDHTNLCKEHEDDTEIIPRSTTVIARRLPALKRGHGKAARYMTDKIPRHAKNQSRKEQTSKTVSKPSVAPSPMDQNMTEEERMKAMFAAQADNWTNQKEELSK